MLDRPLSNTYVPAPGATATLDLLGHPATELSIRVRGLVTGFGSNIVHDGVDLDVHRGEIVGIVGGSGTGKSVLMRALSMLLPPRAGCVEVLGEDIANLDHASEAEHKLRLGVMFQQGALFSSLNVLDNVAMPLREHTDLRESTINCLAKLKIALSGLSREAADQLPGELSGGMLKRAAVARALALDPELLFLDEPSAGLDPVSAEALDALILELRDSLGVTVVLVSHDLDSLWRVTDRIAFLGEKRILTCAPMAEVANDPHPLIRHYFSGPRARAAANAAHTADGASTSWTRATAV